MRDGAARSQLECTIWRERDLYALAAQFLQRREKALRAKLTALGRRVSGAWRAEQKTAALASWLVLAGRCPPGEAFDPASPQSFTHLNK